MLKKITLEELSFDNTTEELLKNFYEFSGLIYKIIITIIPNNQVTLKWEDNINKDSYSEVIETEHIRHISEEELNNSLYITGNAQVKLEYRYRLG